jgi:hypothetical protein
MEAVCKATCSEVEAQRVAAATRGVTAERQRADAEAACKAAEALRVAAEAKGDIAEKQRAAATAACSEAEAQRAAADRGRVALATDLERAREENARLRGAADVMQTALNDLNETLLARSTQDAQRRTTTPAPRKKNQSSVPTDGAKSDDEGTKKHGKRRRAEPRVPKSVDVLKSSSDAATTEDHRGMSPPVPLFQAQLQHQAAIAV